jgi:alpha-N-arabinofuranosidase
MKNRKFNILLLLITIAYSVDVSAQKLLPIIINADKPIAEIKPTMWGIFFEDINFGADGGIYAELVKNRSFEFYRPRAGWKVDIASKDSSHLLVLNRAPFNE